VTKSDLVVRDKDVLSSLAKRNLTAVNFTITPVKAKLLRKMEPKAPSNKKRLEANLLSLKRECRIIKS
jgi:DNA repair photolyase